MRVRIEPRTLYCIKHYFIIPFTNNRNIKFIFQITNFATDHKKTYELGVLYVGNKKYFLWKHIAENIVMCRFLHILLIIEINIIFSQCYIPHLSVKRRKY